MARSHTLSASLAALGGNAIFGLTFLFSKIALNTASPLTLIADRYLVACMAMTLAVVLFRIPLHYRGKPLGRLMLMAMCQPVAYFLCETYGILYTTSAFSSVIIALVPVATTLLGAFLLHERTTVWQNLLILVSVAGVMVMALSGSADGTVTIPGFLLLLGAVAAAAVYNILSRNLSGAFTPLERTFTMAVTGTISFVLIALIGEHGRFDQIVAPFLVPQYAGCVLFLGVAASVGAFFLLNYANTYLMVARATSFSSIVPLVSLAAGILLLGESVSLVQGIAAVMIVGGVLGVQLLGSKRDGA